MQACGLNMQAAAAGVEVGAAMVGVEASWQQVAGYCILKGAGCYNLLVGVDSEMDYNRRHLHPKCNATCFRARNCRFHCWQPVRLSGGSYRYQY